jgi:hypothetical protein
MDSLSRDKVKVLAQLNGWSLARAEGYLDGENFRRRGKAPSTYAQVGIDEYSLGFRAGYYERLSLNSVIGFPRVTMVHPPLKIPQDSVETFDVALASTRSA